MKARNKGEDDKGKRVLRKQGGSRRRRRALAEATPYADAVGVAGRLSLELAEHRLGNVRVAEHA